MTVRTRIAPSPTGDPHVGTAYIALFNLCFARQYGGEFILRIEDTDQVRSTTASEKAIFESLRWLGLDWSEGPDVGGKYGPYRQSERQQIYKGYAEQLIAQGHAFYCYRTPEELTQLREDRQNQGVFTALKPSVLILPPDEITRRQAAGMPAVIRMMVPEQAEHIVIDDLLRGPIEFDWDQVDAQILLKSDGTPTYHLANVVDDHLMEITHVIRGEEWLNSAPKHKLLYEYFGWQMPKLCHLPLLRNPDTSKLSKRKNPTSILYYQAMGFLPEAIVNYLGRMGWSMPDEREKFNLDEMIAHFDIQRVSLGGPVFDVEKLSWLSGLWIRENLSPTELAQRLQHWGVGGDKLLAAVPFVQQRIEILSDFVPLTGFLVAGMLPITPACFDAINLEEQQLKQVLQFALWRLENIPQWHRETIFQQFQALATSMDIKLKDFLAPFFIAIAGTSASFSIMDSMVLLGSDLSRSRIRHALNMLFGALGKKQIKQLEKAYEQLS
jgi:glutamyl-tRNA synthetase